MEGSGTKPTTTVNTLYPALLLALLLAGSSGTLVAHAQTPEPIYLSALLEPTTRKQAAYYRSVEGKLDELFIGRTYSMDGKLKAEGTYMDEQLTIEHGSFVFFHANGAVESRGEYELGNKTGEWERFGPEGQALAVKIYNPEVLANIVHTRAQTMPRSQAGDERELVRYIKTNAQPAQGKRHKDEVTASFIVEKDGSLSDLNVTEGRDPKLNDRVAEVIRSTEPWSPGMERGQPVRVQVRMPIQF